MADIGVRDLPLDGMGNVRDIGGYAASGGRVRAGLVVRGDSPHRLTDAGVAQISELGFRTVIDLRGAREAEVLGRAPLDGLVEQYLRLPLSHSAQGADIFGGAARVPAADLAELYQRFVQHSTEELRAVLRTLADPDRLPVFVHCLGGKDRTGVTVAIVLALLGVDEATIAAEYALTARFPERSAELVAPDLVRLGLDPATAFSPALRSAEPATMLAFLRWVRDTYGSVEGLARALEVPDEVVNRIRTNLIATEDEPG